MPTSAQYVEREVTFGSRDGVPIHGTYVQAPTQSRGTVVLVHGLTESRDEAFGFYKKFTLHLANQGFSSLRFDLRGHGISGLNYQDLTLFNAVSDIEAALRFVQDHTDKSVIHLVGTSFGGGLAALTAALNRREFASLVLLCPNLDYISNWIVNKPYWDGFALTGEGACELSEHGYLSHGDFKIGHDLFHEILHIRPYEWMHIIDAPCLTIHGTEDSVVPHNLSAMYYKCNDNSVLLLIEGADHGFALPDDDTFSAPGTIANLQRVFSAATDWMAKWNGRAL